MIHQAIKEVFMIPDRSFSKLWVGARASRNALPVLFSKLGFTKGVEVGTQRGYFAEVLCSKNPGVELTCVDPWFDKRRAYQRRHTRFYEEALKRLSPYNVKIMRMFSDEAAPLIPDRSLDFVYIDGNHTFNWAMLDILLYTKKVKVGGIIACHDYDNFHETGVVQAVDAYTTCNLITPKYVTRETEPTAFWVNI